MIIELFGTWNSRNGLLDLRETSIISKRRRNLQHKQLKVSFVIQNKDSLKHLGTYHDKHIDPTTKLNWFFVHYLLEAINATIEYRYLSTWGYYNPTTRKWDGIIGDFLSNKSDLGGSAILLIPNRIHLVDFLAMTTETTTKFVFRAPPLSQVSNIYKLPFHRHAWYSICVLFIIIILVIFVMTKFESHSKTRISDILILVIAAFCQTGSVLQTRLSTIRFTLALLFLIASFLFMLYTANIVSLLQSTSTDIQSLQQLLKSNLEFGAEDIPYQHYYLNTSYHATYKSLFNKAPTKSIPFMNLTYGVSKIRKGLFAFHMELGVGYQTIEETFYEWEKCGLTEISLFYLKNPHLVAKKNSPYKEILKSQ